MSSKSIVEGSAVDVWAARDIRYCVEGKCNANHESKCTYRHSAQDCHKSKEDCLFAVCDGHPDSAFIACLFKDDCSRAKVGRCPFKGHSAAHFEKLNGSRQTQAPVHRVLVGIPSMLEILRMMGQDVEMGPGGLVYMGIDDATFTRLFPNGLPMAPVLPPLQMQMQPQMPMYPQMYPQTPPSQPQVSEYLQNVQPQMRPPLSQPQMPMYPQIPTMQPQVLEAVQNVQPQIPTRAPIPMPTSTIDIDRLEASAAE